MTKAFKQNHQEHDGAITLNRAEVRPGQKWTRIDVADDERVYGCYIVDMADGRIYGTVVYAVANVTKFQGDVRRESGDSLARRSKFWQL